VRKLAKLALFFSLSFTIILLIAAGMRLLSFRLEWARTLSWQPEPILIELINAARWAVSFGLYGGILLSISYCVRKKVFVPIAVLCIGLLAFAFTYGASFVLDNWENVSLENKPVQPLGGPGLILTSSNRPTSTVIILLEGPDEQIGPRVVVNPDQPMQFFPGYSGAAPSSVSLPPVSFSDANPWLLESLLIDIRLNAENLQQLYKRETSLFLIYTGALIFILCSLSFIMKISAWPLANLFLGCLAFRGILALETFLNSPEIQNTFDSFLQNRLPLVMAVPVIFCGIGTLVYLYSFLIFLVKRQSGYAN